MFPNCIRNWPIMEKNKRLIRLKRYQWLTESKQLTIPNPSTVTWLTLPGFQRRQKKHSHSFAFLRLPRCPPPRTRWRRRPSRCWCSWTSCTRRRRNPDGPGRTLPASRSSIPGSSGCKERSPSRWSTLSLCSLFAKFTLGWGKPVSLEDSWFPLLTWLGVECGAVGVHECIKVPGAAVSAGSPCGCGEEEEEHGGVVRVHHAALDRRVTCACRRTNPFYTHRRSRRTKTAASYGGIFSLCSEDALIASGEKMCFFTCGENDRL